MRHRFAFIACAVTATAAPACAANRSFPVAGFDRLRVDGPYTVHVHTGPHPAVSAHGSQRRLERLIVEMRDGTLLISTERSAFNAGWAAGEDQPLVIDITVPMLRAAALAGSGDISIDRIRTPAFEASLVGSGDIVISRIDTARLTAAVTGSGTMRLTGHAERADAILRGSGDVNAAELSVGRLTVNVSGSGDLSAGPTRQVSGSLVGSGDVSIAGRPACTISIHGSGNVRCGDSGAARPAS